MTHGGAHGGIRGSPFPMQRRPDGAPVTQCLGSVVLGGGGRLNPTGFCYSPHTRGCQCPPPHLPLPPSGPAWGCPPRTTCCWSTRCSGHRSAPSAAARRGLRAPSPPRRRRPPLSSTGTPAPPAPPSTSTGPNNAQPRGCAAPPPPPTTSRVGVSAVWGGGVWGGSCDLGPPPAPTPM